MKRKHNNWFLRIFSYPVVIKDLLMSFVHEDFIKELRFDSLKKLNPDFVPASEKSRHADVVYEISSQGKTAYIYLFIEFQSTVDWFMPLRMARYTLEFYDELRRINRQKFLNPSFSILLYSGIPVWNAPEKLTDLFFDSPIPKDYFPEFRYFKIAINEIPKRDLVRLRNAVSAVFCIESNNPTELSKSLDDLTFILREVIKKSCGVEIVQQLINRIFEIYRLPENSKMVTSIEDIMEVKHMLETKIKIWEKEILEKGREEGKEKGRKEGKEEGIEETAINMIKNGEKDSKITLYTGLSAKKIEALRDRIRKDNSQ